MQRGALLTATKLRWTGAGRSSAGVSFIRMKVCSRAEWREARSGNGGTAYYATGELSRAGPLFSFGLVADVQYGNKVISSLASAESSL